ncbi:uncharacterized protein F5147DRAFT_647732 [Suillus discolor]|uniref:Uncharacterized protein n=1 Tax=Suillus discolor TaxID=1912936 RepID=A0A9P7FLL3_9AGAM|nr:uncharacterized protein F5147DRAFT_647732 [Suillus discolor]KAG2119866.1 hypothetical protein F5147DRAFT_647732 [Suillus discolor]
MFLSLYIISSLPMSALSQMKGLFGYKGSLDNPWGTNLIWSACVIDDSRAEATLMAAEIDRVPVPGIDWVPAPGIIGQVLAPEIAGVPVLCASDTVGGGPSDIL